MPVHIAWDNDDRTTLLIRYKGLWSWDEFDTMIVRYNALMASASHTVHTITSYCSNDVPLTDVELDRWHRALGKPPVNRGELVFVGDPFFVNYIVPLAGRLFLREKWGKYHTAPSLARARNLIKSLQEARQAV